MALVWERGRERTWRWRWWTEENGGMWKPSLDASYEVSYEQRTIAASERTSCSRPAHSARSVSDVPFLPSSSLRNVARYLLACTPSRISPVR